MVTFNSVDASYADRIAHPELTSSGTGKGLIVRNIQFNDFLTKLFDLSITSGCSFKENGIRACKNFSTSPYFCVDDPSRLSFMGVPSKSEAEQMLVCNTAKPWSSAQKELFTKFIEAVSSDPKKGYTTLELEPSFHNLINERLSELCSSAANIIPLTKEKAEGLARLGVFGTVGSDGSLKNFANHMSFSKDPCYYYLIKGKDWHETTFIVAIEVPICDLYSGRVEDTDSLFGSHSWLKIAQVAFYARTFSYKHRPWFFSVIGLEGVAKIINCGTKLQLPKIDSGLLSDVKEKAYSCFGEDKKLLGDVITDLASLNDGENVVFDESADVASQLVNFISSLPEKMIESASIESTFEPLNGLSSESKLKKLYDAICQLHEYILANSTEEVTPGIPSFDIVDLKCSGFGLRLKSFNMNPLLDLIDFEGASLLETASNLFYLTSKGDSLGPGGYSNNVLSAFDGNTYGGMVSEWVARGKGDIEQSGLLRGITGGDMLFVFKKISDQSVLLDFPLRMTHRVSSPSKDGRWSTPRYTIHDFIGKFVVYLTEDGESYDLTFNIDGFLNKRIPSWYSAHGDAVLKDSEAVAFINYVVTPPSHRKRVVYYSRSFNDRQIASYLDDFSRPDDVIFLGSAVVPPDYVELINSVDDPFFKDSEMPEFESINGQTYAVGTRHYRSQAPKLFAREQREWEKIDHLSLISKFI